MIVRIDGREGARAVAERMRKRIEETPVYFGDRLILVTASVGIATAAPPHMHESPDRAAGRRRPGAVPGQGRGAQPLRRVSRPDCRACGGLPCQVKERPAGAAGLPSALFAFYSGALSHCRSSAGARRTGCPPAATALHARTPLRKDLLVDAASRLLTFLLVCLFGLGPARRRGGAAAGRGLDAAVVGQGEGPGRGHRHRRLQGRGLVPDHRAQHGGGRAGQEQGLPRSLRRDEHPHVPGHGLSRSARTSRSSPCPPTAPSPCPGGTASSSTCRPAGRARASGCTSQGINYRANIWVNGKQIAKPEDGGRAPCAPTSSTSPSTSSPAPRTWWRCEVWTPKENDLAITFVDWNPAPPDKSMGLWREVYLSTQRPGGRPLPRRDRRRERAGQRQRPADRDRAGGERHRPSR